ncbi:MAG: DUF1669 domain-containing protein, partial [Chloroflexaceae bacterium]|nr:DUF1669 domain-containing protein [Chloroflexaceae bacterium]
MIDLRSDTVTLPTPAMREAIARAELGDDVYGEDPTINRMQALAAEKVGKEAALLVPTGTMGNLSAMLAHCGRGDQVIVGSECHIYQYEAGGASVLGGLMYKVVPNLPDGDMLHHKYGVVDGATVVTGSHNWSIAANHLNDETVLVIEDPVVAAHFQREFERLYRDSRRGAPKRVVDTAAQDCQTLRSAQVGGQKRRRSRRRPSNRPQEQPTDLGR